jgi:soluble lytic murein transglycosylase
VRRLPAVVALLALALVALAVGARLGVPLLASVGDLPLRYPLEHADAIRDGARRYDLEPALVAAVVFAESRFDERARSERGAIGLMQVLPETADQIAAESGGVTFTAADLEDPHVNVRYGCYYLRYALDLFDGDLRAAVAAYNAGVGTVAGWREQAAAQGRRLLPREIRFEETRAYVRQVLDARTGYRETYGRQLDRQ